MDGLAQLCKQTLRQDPFSGWVFVFRNRRATALKVLVYDGQGFGLCHKRLSSGRFRWWPTRSAADDAVQQLAAHQRQLSGDWKRVYGHPLYFVETFVAPERFRGTCYRAANWLLPGTGQQPGRPRLGCGILVVRAIRSRSRFLGLKWPRGQSCFRSRGRRGKPAVNTDQNLLFGVLALELDFIDVRQFAEVCCTWAGYKEKGLADLLVERNWIRAEERDEVQRMMDRKVRRRQGDVRQALSDVAGPQLRDVMHGVGDVEVEQTLSQLEPVPGFVRVSETAELAQGELSHYTLSRVHDQGGLGRVWLAFDKSLCRDVALKEIRPDKLPTDQALRRFVREAQITGQLEHPNIVPVYELAHDQQRTYPFYTMRFVHGQSLGDAIEAYHKQRRAGAAAGLEFRRLLQAFISVCHAIAYAHSRRVIHRDLKPSNVMLGHYGEVVVLDWGLAKILDKPEELPEEEQPVARLDGATGVETQPGQILGTPAYMAPEQALSKHREIDALTDVYGLGAILYRILTGERPHRGHDSQERMRHAAEDPTPEPRLVDASLPRPLSAICRKAMSRNRLDRYLSATAAGRRRAALVG